ncbi:Ribonuclease H-like domain containing protein [Lactarius tabidus]
MNGSQNIPLGQSSKSTRFQLAEDCTNAYEAPMDTLKPFRDACTPNGRLKDADEIKWVNDPDDDCDMMNHKSTGRSSPPRRLSTQTSLTEFGAIRRGVNPADENGVGGIGGSTNNVSARPIRACKLPAKFKEALTGSGKKTSKIKRKVIIDGEEKAKPPKKSKTRLEAKELDTTDTDQVNLDEGPKGLNTRVFSQASEDAQDTHANTEVSSNLDNSGNTSTEENERSNTRGSVTDEEEWAYLQLDMMATKDAQIASTHHRTCKDPQKTSDVLKHRGSYPQFKDLYSVTDYRVRHWGTHKGRYMAGCQREQVEPNERIMSNVMKPGEGAETQKQESLEKWTVTKVPQWSKAGLMEHIVELVVVDDQAISLVDRAAFRHLLLFLRPTIRDCDIPHRSSIAKAIHDKAHKVRETLKELFSSVPGEVSVTLDGWSSLTRDPYLGVTVHWVHSSPETPSEWSLRTLLLAFREVKGNHSGENLAKIVMEIFKEAGLSSKIGWITSDNVTSNDRMMSRLEDELNLLEHEWKAPDCRVRCLAHIIHLAAKHIVQAFSQDGPIMESDFPMDTPADLDEDSETSYVSGDTLRKLWAFINQGITKFIQLADDSSQVPKLSKKFYADYRQTPSEWANLGLLHQILKVFTSHNLAGISNLTKWYRRLDVCHVYAVSTVIDPSIKLVYIKKNWGPDFVLHTRTILTTIFDKYNQSTEEISNITPSSTLQPGWS